MPARALQVEKGKAAQQEKRKAPHGSAALSSPVPPLNPAWHSLATRIGSGLSGCACGGTCAGCAGQPLDGATRRFMEPRLGRNLSAVRVHADAAAATASARLGARAFTVGRDIFFNHGQYNPASARGRYVLAHELAHVAQYDPHAGAASRAALENDAGHAARAVALGLPRRVRETHSAAVPLLLGEPETIPDFTFISAPLPGDNGFIQSAIDYHTDWGLNPQVLPSMQRIVNALSSGTGHIGRLRIVSHANVDNLFLELFGGSVRGIRQEHLAGFAFSDAAGLEAILSAGTANSLVFGSQSAAVTSALVRLRQTNPAVLRPFGLEPAGSAPTGGVAFLQEFLDRCLDLMFINRGTITVGPDAAHASPITAGQRAALVTATETILADLEADITSPLGARTLPQISTSDTQALKTAITGLTLADVNLTTMSVRLGADILQDVAAANRAIAAGFRTTLDAVKARFDETSTIDVRGCRIGQNPAYLGAIQCFFGRDRHLPTVTGPEWFQSFPSFGWQTVADEAGVDGLAASGFTGSGATFTASDVGSAVTLWSGLAGVGAQLRFWRTLFGDSVEFVSLRWRSRVPSLAMESDLGDLSTVTLADAITRIRRVFHLPSTAAPTTTQTTALAQQATPAVEVLAVVEQAQALQSATTPDAAALQALQQRLQTLRQTIAPGTTPGFTGTPTAASLLQEAQQLRTTFQGQITSLDPFLQAAATKAGHTNAEIRLYFHLGFVLPVQSGAAADDIFLFALDPLANAAVRRWLNATWSGAVPAGAAVLQPPVRLSNVRSRRYAALSDSHGGPGMQQVFAPSPAYMSHIVVLHGGTGPGFTCGPAGTNAPLPSPTSTPT